MEGPVFRAMPEEELLPLLPKLQVGAAHAQTRAAAHCLTACLLQ
jgi:hypothetical protein